TICYSSVLCSRTKIHNTPSPSPMPPRSPSPWISPPQPTITVAPNSSSQPSSPALQKS
ncbi:hypothetical protein GALMADRAFT_243888, partial [Galerina marginata CBS 339.88]